MPRNKVKPQAVQSSSAQRNQGVESDDLTNEGVKVSPCPRNSSNLLISKEHNPGQQECVNEGQNGCEKDPAFHSEADEKKLSTTRIFDYLASSSDKEYDGSSVASEHSAGECSDCYSSKSMISHYDHFEKSYNEKLMAKLNRKKMVREQYKEYKKGLQTSKPTQGITYQLTTTLQAPSPGPIQRNNADKQNIKKSKSCCAIL